MSRPVLALCLEFPIALRGGVSVLVETLASAIAEKFRLVLVSTDTPESFARSPSAACFDHHICWNPAKTPPSAHFRTTARSLTETLLRLNVRIAHFHCGGVFGWGNRLPGFSPVELLASRGVRVFWTDHLTVALMNGYCSGAKPLWFKLAMLPFAYAGKLRQIAAVQAEIAVSNQDLNNLQRWYFPLRRKIHRIYHSRLPDQPPPASEKRGPIVLNVGHIAFRKGQHVLAGAFAQIAPHFPKWSLHLAGHDAGDGCWQAVEKIICDHRLEGRILLLGQRDDAMDLMKRAQIYVQPSFHEGLPLALQEAIFAGCPVIGTRIGGVMELIADGCNGLLVSAGSVEEMAQALKRMLADGNMRDTMGSEGPELIQARQMTQSDMVNAHLELYQQALTT